MSDYEEENYSVVDDNGSSSYNDSDSEKHVFYNDVDSDGSYASDASVSEETDEDGTYYDDIASYEEERDEIIKSAICDGTLLNREYVLLRKIGEGNNATVWICYKISDKNYYAIKIQNPMCYDDGIREVDIINCINKYNNNNVGQVINCVVMLDSFKHIINEGTDDEIIFVCSLYQLYAGSLQRLIEGGKYEYGLPIDVVKRITRQLLNGADILHRHLHIVHTDLHLYNILFEGDADEFLSIVEFFMTSGFEENYEALASRYGVVNGVVCKDVEMLYVQELEFLCKESIDLMGQYEQEYFAKSSEKIIRDIDRKDRDDMKKKICEETYDDFYNDDDDDMYNNGDLISDDDLSNSEYMDSSEEVQGLEIDRKNVRNQSIADMLQDLDNDTLYNLDEDDTYDFEKVRNLSSECNKFEIIPDEFVQNCNIAITDFGNSYFLSELTENEIQSRWYRAPEIILDLKYNEKCDIWSIGCTVFELLTGYRLFYINEDDKYVNKDLHHLYVLEKIVGPVPLDMKLKSKRLNWLFDSKRDYHIKNVDYFDYVGLEHILQYQHLFSENETSEIANFLRAIFVYDPAKRPSAHELLEHPWLN